MKLVEASTPSNNTKYNVGEIFSSMLIEQAFKILVRTLQDVYLWLIRSRCYSQLKAAVHFISDILNYTNKFRQNFQAGELPTENRSGLVNGQKTSSLVHCTLSVLSLLCLTVRTQQRRVVCHTRRWGNKRTNLLPKITSITIANLLASPTSFE